ncbi:MAG: 50S ribosomal protein L24e [Candidatus Marsarchaeota archaeon]|nr:50S ribosomal protein L24e [Candidatus Marsarchaeota archaeon]
MVKCSYCSEEIERGTGFAYVKKVGTVRYYCSKRCYKLSSMGRKLKIKA